MMLGYDPLLDPEAEGCPHGCGRLTDDPYGGPCSSCWAALEDDYDGPVGISTVRTVLDEPTYAEIAAEKRRDDL